MYMFVDRTTGAMLGITIFESEDAIRAAEPIFERMGDEVGGDPGQADVRRRYGSRSTGRGDAAAARLSTSPATRRGSTKAASRSADVLLMPARSRGGRASSCSSTARRAPKTITLWRARTTRRERGRSGRVSARQPRGGQRIVGRAIRGAPFDRAHAITV
jgi:hypothetical protein